jgi:hypothetical protein
MAYLELRPEVEVGGHGLPAALPCRSRRGWARTSTKSQSGTVRASPQPTKQSPTRKPSGSSIGTMPPCLMGLGKAATHGAGAPALPPPHEGFPHERPSVAPLLGLPFPRALPLRVGGLPGLWSGPWFSPRPPLGVAPRANQSRHLRVVHALVPLLRANPVFPRPWV